MQYDIIALSYTNCIKYGITPEDVVEYYNKVVDRLKRGIRVPIQALSEDTFAKIDQGLLDHIKNIDHSVADITAMSLTASEIFIRVGTSVDLVKRNYVCRPILSKRDGLELVFVLNQ